MLGKIVSINKAQFDFDYLIIKYHNQPFALALITITSIIVVKIFFY